MKRISPRRPSVFNLIFMLVLLAAFPASPAAQPGSPVVGGADADAPFAANPVWKQTAGPVGGQVTALFAQGTTVLAGTRYRGIYRSTDGGQSWRPANKGFESLTFLPIPSAFASSGSALLAATEAGVFRSLNNGESWTRANVPYIDFRITNAVVTAGNNIFIGGNDGVFRSTDNGDTWTRVSTGLSGGTVWSMAALGNRIYAGTRSGGIFRSENNGESWTAINNGLTNLFGFALQTSGAKIFAGTGGGGVFLSTDNGDSWAAVNTGLTNFFCGPFAEIGTNLFVATDAGVFRSSNGGENWTAVNQGLPTSLVIWSLGASGNTLLAGTYDGVFRSTNTGETWENANAGLTDLVVRSFAAIGKKVFAGIDGPLVATSGGRITVGGIHVTADEGRNWRAGNTGLPATGIKALFFTGAHLLAGTGGGMYRSSDEGQNWTAVSLGSGSAPTITAISKLGNALFASDFFGAIYRSSDNGDTWARLSIGVVNLSRVLMASSEKSLFVGTFANGIFRSQDQGATWTPVNTGLPTRRIGAIAASGATILAGTEDSGVFLSTDEGATWKAVNTGLTKPDILSLSIIGNSFWAGTKGGGVFLSTSRGENWVALNEGLTDLNVVCVTGLGSKVYLGTGGDRVGRVSSGSGAFISDSAANSIISLSAASYSGAELAPESLVAAFGKELAAAAEQATGMPLPTTLAGSSITVTDSLGTARPAPLFFVSHGQVNFQIPPGTATGPATVRARTQAGTGFVGSTQINNIAPGLFSANGNGQGPAAAVALRVRANGAQLFEPVVRFDAAQNLFVAIPIDLGPEDDQLFLVLFGTGFRFRSTLGNAGVTLGGTDAQVTLAGAQGDLVGVDQLNVRVPRSLAGRGEVEVALTVDSKSANKVTVVFK